MPRYIRNCSDASGALLTPLPVPFRDFVVNPDGLSAEAATALAKLRSEAARLDFSLPLYQVVPTLRREKLITLANWRHANGEVVARFAHSRRSNPQPPAEGTSLLLLSLFEDGRRLVTSDAKPQIEPPPDTISQGFLGLTFGELLALHRHKLDELRRSGSVKLIADDEALARLCDLAEIETTEHYVKLGLCAWADPAQIAAEPPLVAESALPPAIDSEEAAVLAEIDRQQNKPFNWNSAIALAVLSLLAFIVIGGSQWDWEFAGILAGVMVVHEAGHYVAMRIFKFKNLRMFFIPMIGAAVTGRHYNIKGWQTAVVYLAGPVPGIFGALILIALTVDHPSHLTQNIALMSLLINGINLLPVMPLDGGGIMNSIIFCRHYLLETAFLVFAAIALILATCLGYGSFWIYIGLGVAVSLPASYQLVRVAALLKARGISAASPDDQSIPSATALTILRELRLGQRFNRGAKQLANEVLNVFQKLNASPPGAAASALLLAIYLGSGAAAFFGAKAIVNKRQRIFSGDVRGIATPAPCKIIFTKLD